MNNKSYNKCKCGKIIHKLSKRCKLCYWKSLFKGGLPKCVICGKTLSGYTYKRCIKHSNVAENNPRFKKIGSKFIDNNGYIKIKVSNPSNWKLEHRVLVEKYIKRKLNKKQIIHHINGNRKDNNLKNLYIFSDNMTHKCFETLVNKNIISKFILKTNLNKIKESQCCH